MLSLFCASMLFEPGGKLAYSMSTFAERLQLALAESGKTRAELAAALEISPQAVGQQLAGATKSMTAENAARAARLLQVDLHWLCTGEGTMLAQPPGQSFANRISIAAAELALQFDSVPLERQRALYAQLQDLIRRATVGPALPPPDEPPIGPRRHRPQKAPL